MSTNRGGQTLRFDAGRYEESVLGLILLVQFTLAAMFVVTTVGWAFFTLGAWTDADRSVTFLSGAIPYLVGMAVAVYLLNFLYE